MTVTLEVANPTVLALLRDMECLDLVQMKDRQDESAAAPPLQERVFGCARGKFRMASDFDEPLEDFAEYGK
jgi:hypothetical protein